MKKKKSNGFTILEMMIALIIIGIFVALSLSIARTAIERSSFTTAINQFVSDFYYAKQLAARENRYVAIIFNADGRSYGLRIQPSMASNPENTGEYDPLPNPDYGRNHVEPMHDKQFFEDVTSFAFSPTGVIRRYPVDLDTAPISFSLTFLRETRVPGEKDFKKKIQVYPSGGIKIDTSSRK